MIGATGTCIGGAIGYLLAWRIGSSVLKNIAAKEDIEKGGSIDGALWCHCGFYWWHNTTS